MMNCFHVFCDLETFSRNISEPRSIFMFGMIVCDPALDEVSSMECIVRHEVPYIIDHDTLAWHMSQPSWPYISDCFGIKHGLLPQMLPRDVFYSSRTMIQDIIGGANFKIWANRQFDYPLLIALARGERQFPHPLLKYTRWRDISAYRDDFGLMAGNLQKHTTLNDCRNNIVTVKDLLSKGWTK